MSGRYLTVLCWLFGHAEPIHHVRARGAGWECPTCLRFKPSAVLQAVRRA